MEKVTQFKDVTLTYDTAAAANLKIYTDLPGGLMTLRRTIALTITAGRETRTYPLDKLADGGLLEGKLVKWRIEPAGVMRLYDGMVRFRRIGTYVDGTVGEVWETQELSLGG